MTDTQFDYVVAGGGTAGCVLAARLSEDPSVSVCLVEAGPTDVGDKAILELAEWMHLLDSGYDWDYPVEPQERGNSFMRHARAKVLGGCSSHNSCIAFHPPAETLDDWAAAGATGWGASDILPFVARVENNDTGRGQAGPVRIRDVPPGDPCGAAVLESAAGVGLPTVAFNRGTTVLNGAGWFQINAGEDGQRMSTSHAYLHPIIGTRPNLEVRTDCWISEILIDESLTATGVRYQRPDLTGYDTVSARREVIVTAGAIDTPKLLMLSGIGPAAQLQEMGITVRVDSPGVGENLDDHVEGLVFWEASKPMATTSSQWWEIGVFAQTDASLNYPDIMMHYGSVPFDMNTLRWGYPTTDNGFCLTPNVTQGRSRGTVRLRSRVLSRSGQGGSALLHRPRRPRRRRDARRSEAGSQNCCGRPARGMDRTRTGTRARCGDRRGPARLRAQDAQHGLSPGGNGADGVGGRRHGRTGSRTSSEGNLTSTRRRRVGDAEAPVRQSQHHRHDHGGEMRRPDPWRIDRRRRNFSVSTHLSRARHPKL
ncbi:Choline dehydrogenase [Rhodococcus sp. AW25M09]|nr:Choline dehydrogenase [Rhodococcus sp. AW25M09]